MLKRASSSTAQRATQRVSDDPFVRAFDALSGAKRLPDVPGRNGESALVWLARCVALSAVSGETPSDDPREMVVALRRAVEGAFGRSGPQAFPLLCGPLPDRRARVPELTRAVRILGEPAARPPGRDLLGAVHRAGVDSEVRGALSQHHTPPALAELVVERTLSYTEERVPLTAFDPAAGTGALMVPLAARWRRSGLSATKLLRGLRGAELCPVSHSLAQSNLLLHLGPALRERVDVGYLPLPGLHNVDALKLMGGSASPGYEVCLGNPPFLGERGNRRTFDRLVAENPSLSELRWARGDLAYWFIILGLWSLRPGGVLGFITPAYWLTADGASELRGLIAQRALVHELIDFRDQVVFPTAPGEQTLVSILRRRGRDDDSCGPTLTVRVRRPAELPRICEEIDTAAREARASGEDVVSAHIEARWGDPFSSSCVAGPWFIRSCNRTEATLDHLASRGQPLGELLEIKQGLVSGADRVTATTERILRQVGVACRAGDGVFVLTEDEVARLGLRTPCRLVRPFYKNSDIRDHWVASAPSQYVLYVADGIELADHPAVEAHLRRFIAILARRRECLLGRIPWYRLHWPRVERMFVGPKIVCPQRAPRNRFAFHNGDLFASADVYFLRSYTDTAQELRYYEALLNSAPMDLWFANRGKRKGRQREYYATPLAAMPVVPYRPSADLHGVASLIRTEAAEDPDDLLARARWCRMNGDVAALHTALASVGEALRSCRRCLASDPTPDAPSDTREYLRLSILERRLEECRDELAMDLVGLAGDSAWMRGLVLEHASVGDD